MAGEDGPQAGDVAFLEALAEEPWKYGFLASVRRLDTLRRDKPRTGRATQPKQDAVRFSQEPFMEFAPSTLSGLYRDEQSAAPRLAQRFLGLFGPDGPLPSHLTQYARSRERQARDPSFARFCDMFHHRIVSLFYRAWSQAQPTVQFDRPEEDRFHVYVGALIGLGTESLKDKDAMLHVSKLSFAGHLGSLPRHPEGLSSLLGDYFEVPVAIKEFIAHWLRIPRQDHLRLGLSGHNGHLGRDTVIGERVWQRQDKFRVVLGPLDLEQYTAFLPTGKSFQALVAAVRNYAGVELLWEVNLVLKGADRPVTCLGKSGALGWTSWLESKRRDRNASDLMLQVQNYVH